MSLPSRGSPAYAVEWTTEALDDLAQLRPFDQRPTRRAVVELGRQAETATRNRKPLRGAIDELPEASWEMRIAELARELPAMVHSYDGSARKARELLEALLIAKEEGLAAVSAIRHELALKMARKRAA